MGTKLSKSLTKNPYVGSVHCMTTILRHGDAQHAVRPDRVYRTGVLTSIVGYQPQADVQAVAAAFTLGPAGGMTLQGYGLGSGANWFERMKLRMQAWVARKQLKVQARQEAVSGFPAPQPPGPTQQAQASQLSPDQAGRAQAVFMLVGHPGMSRGDRTIRDAATVIAQRRNASLYWAG